MKKWFTRIYYTFPIQLLLLHCRSNLSLLALWAILFAIVAGGAGRSMGFHYLFLDPEYLGEVSFWSFFLVGLSFGFFFIAWNTTTYILHSYRFPFLASFNRPFAKFSINNALLPVIFVLYYVQSLVNFQWYNEFAAQHKIIYYCLGFFTGIGSTVLASILYFQYTNRDILSVKPNKLKLSKAIRSLTLRKRRETWDIEQEENPYKYAWRVDYFFTERLRLRPVRNVQHYNFRRLERIFRQNHANALIIQSLSIVALILMGAFVEYKVCRIPSASSLLLLFSVISTILGAISYWLQEWRTIFLICLILFLNYLVGIGVLYYENKAYGLNYDIASQEYSYAILDSLSKPEYQRRDKQAMEAILDAWRKKLRPQTGYSKPRMILICASGGGLRASLWAMQVLRELDRTSNGQFLEHTVLLTGSSGGMLGMAYYRELALQKKRNIDLHINLSDTKYLEYMGKDLANAVSFTMTVNDLFVPWMNREVNGYTYKQDRGYMFEQQLIENTEGLLDKNLGDYRKAEQQADIPMMILSPVIINDGRFLLISPQGLSHLMQPVMASQEGAVLETDGVDFGALFKDYDADNMRFSTGLRMSATYPMILPSVHLPTRPGIEVMDAGFRDNYGIELATRFCQLHKDWIEANTSGVLLISIRGSEKLSPIPKTENQTIFNNFFRPLSSVLNVDMMQDYHHDNYVSSLQSLLGKERFELMQFTYKPTHLEERASLSLHLTRREKNDIMNAIYLDDNQYNIRRLKSLLKYK